MKTIKLKFGTLTRLAGNPYGRKTYKEQIEDKIDFNDQTKIVFPETINGISISFIQGLMDEPVKLLGSKKEFEKKIILYSPIEKVQKKIDESIWF